MTGEGWGSTLHLAKLKTLHLSHCDNLTDRGVFEIFNIAGSQLEEINLSSTSLTGELFSNHLPSLNKVRYVDLMRSRDLTSSSICKLLNKCEQIESVWLNDNCISDELLGVNFLKNLKALSLNHCRELTPAGLLKLVKMYGSQLKYLSLMSCPLSSTGTYSLRGRQPFSSKY